MKKLIILILISILALCGCGQKSDDAAYPSNEPLPPIADIKLYSDEEPGEEYADAKVSGYWIVGELKQELSDEPAEIKLRGNSSKEAKKKAYTVKFEEPMEFLGMESGKKWAFVSNPFDKSMLRPAVGFTYAKAIGLEFTPDVRMCKVWLNDEYMGVYTVMEPIESGEGRVEVDPENGDFLIERNLDREEDDVIYIVSPQELRYEMNEPEELNESEYKQCSELLAQAEEAINTCDHRQYKKYIDVDSFVNFYIFHEMMKDIDFGEYSTRYYFKDGKMYAGPPWDLDFTTGNVSKAKDEDKYGVYNPGKGFYGSAQDLWVYSETYYYCLCQDDWFMKRVADRWNEVRQITENITTDNAFGSNMIDQYLAAYRAELEEDFELNGQELHMSEWQEPAETYIDNVEMLRNWIIKRADYLDTRFK